MTQEADWKLLTIHPLAKRWPRLYDQDFERIVASIAANGLREPITLFEGKILDGVNRYRACLEAAVKPTTVDFTGTDPAAFVRDKNLHRRHLTPGQRAMFMAEDTKTLAPGDVGTQRASDGRHWCRPSLSLDEAAEIAKVSPRTMGDAVTVKINGTPAEVELVKIGKVSVKAMAKKVRSQAKHGVTTTVPDGYANIIDAVLATMEFEKNDARANAERAAKQTGVSLNVYRAVRDLLLLSKHDGLSKKDAAFIARSVQDIKATGQVRVVKLRPALRPMVARVWGSHSNRFKAGKARLDAFRDSLSHMRSTCNAASAGEIPVLGRDERNEFMSMVADAQVALATLHRRVQGENND